MKRALLIWAVALMVLATTGLWIFYASDQAQPGMWVLPLGILIVIGFAVFLGISRWQSYRRSEPQEDEYSVQLMTKATSISFYLSLYWWLVIMYLSDKVKLEAHSLVGAGILGMALLFVLSWLYFRFKGLDHA